MTNTAVQTIVEAAYSRSTANDPGKLATDGELVLVANRIYQVLYAVMAAAAPERCTTSQDLVLVGSTISLPTDIIDIRRVQGKTGTVAAGKKINIIPIEEIERGWHLAPCVYRTGGSADGGSLTSRGQAGDPGATDTITIYMLDAPATLSSLASTLDLRFPVRFQELIIVELAMYLSTKDANRDAGEFQKLSAYRNMQLEMFLKLCGLSTTGLTTPFGGMIVQTLNKILNGMPGAPQGQSGNTGAL